jgi:hypothetical protein
MNAKKPISITLHEGIKVKPRDYHFPDRVRMVNASSAVLGISAWEHHCYENDIYSVQNVSVLPIPRAIYTHHAPQIHSS